MVFFSFPMDIAHRFRKLTLLAHIAFSIGWFGAVIPYIALTITGLVSRDAQTVRSAYLALELIGWFVLVPLSIAALFSGLIQSLGTQWGLFRHWWIVAKFVLTVFAIVILITHMRDVSRAAHVAKDILPFNPHFRPELVHSIGGLLVLLAAMVLSVFKPWGLTPYGERQRSQLPSRPQAVESAVSLPAPNPTIGVMRIRPRWKRIALYHAIGLGILFSILHLTGLHHH
jgi:hypothetical protein